MVLPNKWFIEGLKEGKYTLLCVYKMKIIIVQILKSKFLCFRNQMGLAPLIALTSFNRASLCNSLWSLWFGFFLARVAFLLARMHSWRLLAMLSFHQDMGGWSLFVLFRAIVASRAEATLRITLSASSCALLAAVRLKSSASWNSSASNLFAFHFLRYLLLYGGFSLVWSLVTAHLISRWSLMLTISCTVQSFPPLTRLWVVQVRSTIEVFSNPLKCRQRPSIQKNHV